MSTQQTKIAILTFLAAATAPLGCLPASTSPMDAGMDGGGLVTYTHDVQPIFQARCSPCHAGEGLGGHNIAINYADAKMPVQSFDAMGCWGAMDPNTGELSMPKTVGECALISIMRGWMPMGMQCFNDPRPATCVQLDEQDVIAAWVAMGMPQ